MSVRDVIDAVLINLGLRRHLRAWWGLSGFGLLFFGLKLAFTRFSNIVSPCFTIHLALINLCRCRPTKITSL